MANLEGKTIVLGVTGGIAAYKACEIVSRLKKEGAAVYVIMTRNACEFVRPMNFEVLSQNPVALDTFTQHFKGEVEHIALAKRADLMLIAPATANVIAKLAIGLADDLLTTTALATKAPMLIAPAMNTVMWQHPATKSNLETLISRGAHTVGPEGGLLACGDVGAGRMSEPEDIVHSVKYLLERTMDLKGFNVLVTAGPTREALDPVRFLSNRSSGKMGYAIAAAAKERGAEVTLVSGPVSLQKPAGVETVAVMSTKEMFDAVVSRASQADILIQAAAPADFTFEHPAAHKIKKDKDEVLSLSLIKTPDIAKSVGEKKKWPQVFVGFAAETENHLDNARRKLAQKALDLIVLNDVSQKDAGFEVDTNIITLITPLDEKALPLMSKTMAAGYILDEALRLRKEKEAVNAT